jgi:hypothetical protein
MFARLLSNAEKLTSLSKNREVIFCVKLRYLSLLCAVLLWQACNTDKTEAPILDTTVAKEYELNLWESLENSVRTFQIRASTIKSEDCLNYSIESAANRFGNSFEINLGKPLVPTTCERGFGPAKSYLDLGILTNGTYNLTIKLGQIVPSTGRLIVNNGSYYFYMPAPIGFKVKHNTLYRIPDNTIWGYIDYELTASPIVEQFLVDLNKISQDAGLSKGYYGYFNMLDNETIELEKVVTDRPIHPILRRFQANDKDLENLIKSYRDRHGKSILINLRNTLGKEF